MNNIHAKGVALILGAAILWGTTGTAQSLTSMSLSSYWVGAARLLIASVFLLMWVLFIQAHAISGKQLRTMPWGLVLAAAVSMAIYNLAFFAGVQATSVAIGTAIALGSGPVWAGAIQAIGYRKQPSKSWWLAVSIAITGLIIASVSPQENTVRLPWQGIGLCLLSGIAYAFYALISKQLVSTMPVSTTAALVFSLAAVCALPMAWATSGTPHLNTSDIPVLLWLGVGATGIAYLLFNAGLQYVTGATGVALALAEPVAALVLAVVIVGERLTLTTAAGMVLVFTGLCLLVRSERS